MRTAMPQEAEMSLEHRNPSLPPLSRQDQIQWGILFLTRKLRHLSPEEREHCLQETWEWARERADLLSLQMIRDYRECLKSSGPTFRRHRDWFWNNRKSPEFWAEWDRRFAGLETQTKAENVRSRLGLE
jgi:hypothetical protein